MKQLSLLVSASLLALGLQAQIKEGIVVYEQKVNNHKRINNEEMKAMMPEFRTSKHQLLFNDTSSLYKNVVEEETMDPFEGGGGGRRMMRFGGNPNDEVYKNYNSGITTKATELADKNFILEDTIRKQGWKLAMSETKTILGHVCYKATSKRQQMTNFRGFRMGGGSADAQNTNTQDSAKRPEMKEIEVVAWFASDIKTPAGPDVNGGLPGLILELDVNDGEAVFTAKEIKEESVAKSLKVPTKGKKISNDEYRKLQRQMFENMQGGGGGRGGIMIGRPN